MCDPNRVPFMGVHRERTGGDPGEHLPYGNNWGYRVNFAMPPQDLDGDVGGGERPGRVHQHQVVHGSRHSLAVRFRPRQREHLADLGPGVNEAVWPGGLRGTKVLVLGTARSCASALRSAAVDSFESTTLLAR
ncbi:MAG TPA: hypothetical protein VME46_23135, partial [Acidimicrobiales bacterium]|nr:hypothetical protein [Acidimicrobiales bacterium]